MNGRAAALCLVLAASLSLSLAARPQRRPSLSLLIRDNKLQPADLADIFIDAACCGRGNGLSPLQHASKVGARPATVQMIIDASANIHAAHSTGTTALMFAAREGSTEALLVLLAAFKRESGGSGSGSGASSVDHVLAELERTDEHLNTALHLAALGGKVASARVLIEAGGDRAAAWMLRKNSHGNTALQYAAHKCDLGATLTDMLLAVPAVAAAVDEPANNGRTALMLAANNNRVQCVASLLKAGANPHAGSGTGDSALSLATSKGHAKVVELFQQHGGVGGDEL